MSGEHRTLTSAVEASHDAREPPERTGRAFPTSDGGSRKGWCPGSLEGMGGSKDKQGLRELGDTEVLWEEWQSPRKPAWTRYI